MESIPQWDLSSIFPSPTSAELAAAIADVAQQINELEQFLAATTRATPELSADVVAAPLAESIDGLNRLMSRSDMIHEYLNAATHADSRDADARKRKSEFAPLRARVETLRTRWQAWVGQLAPLVEQAIAAHPTLQAHAFILRETAAQAKYRMSDGEEALAAELKLSGATAWEQLQRTVTSQLTVDFELAGKMQKLAMPTLINLHNHPDEEVRRRAYEAESQAWATVREPLAASLNGIKGTVNTLNRRRGRTDALHTALDEARIDRDTLDAMLGAMEVSLPIFRHYFKAKAHLLGKTQLAWWDLFAPIGKLERRYSWAEACCLILEHFATFSPDLAALAQRAFDEQWLDAEPRVGKSGGARVIPLFDLQSSRIMLHFDGSLHSVSVLAHELGHAYHIECTCRANKTFLQAYPPMTLAETASTICEILISQATLAQTQDPQEELAILELDLCRAGQVIVDIYSRYLFEQEVFARRAQAELSADDFCEIMTRAQQATYGDGLDPQYLQPYMWTWKPHYYSAELSFYNFPYAFGLLFGTGLYAIYQQRGAAFVADYRDLLASMGEASAADLAARFGINIRSRQFWDDSLAVLAQQVNRFCALCEEQAMLLGSLPNATHAVE